jgi:hypothetical protein
MFQQGKNNNDSTVKMMTEVDSTVNQSEEAEQIQNSTRASKRKHSSVKKLKDSKKRRHRTMILKDSSDQEHIQINKNKVKAAGTKSKKRVRVPKVPDVDPDLAKKKYVVDQAIKTAARLRKRYYGKKSEIDDSENIKKKDRVEIADKNFRRSKKKMRTISMSTKKSNLQVLVCQTQLLQL